MVVAMGCLWANTPPSTDGGVVLSGAVGKGSPAEVLQAYIDAGALPGAISMTAVSGKVECACLGLADFTTGRKMDEKSYFWIASMSKGFCGAAVMTCVDKGLLSLDDPVEKYVPEVANVKVAEKNVLGFTKLRAPKVKMTIGMCLAHVAGFEFDACPCAETPKLIGGYKLLWDPMTKHKYANVDIELAARCVEVVTGVEYGEYLRRAFFDPLGMTETTFTPTPEQLARLVRPARVKTGRKWEDGSDDFWAKRHQLFRGKAPRAAGGLYATAGDVMKFYLMLANDGKAPDGRRILSHESIVALSTARYPKLDCYSLGLRQFGDWFGHDGALQTEAFANWKENRAALMFIQVTGDWRQPFKKAWHDAALGMCEK